MVPCGIVEYVIGIKSKKKQEDAHIMCLEDKAVEEREEILHSHFHVSTPCVSALEHFIRCVGPVLNQAQWYFVSKVWMSWFHHWRNKLERKRNS